MDSITADTTQFQCDEGATPTSGFSVDSSGKLQFNNTGDFIACQTGQNDGRNVYTSNSTSVTGCTNVQLTADSCSGASPSGSGSASSPIASPSGGASTGAPSSVPVAPSSSVPAGPGSEAPTGAPTEAPTGAPTGAPSGSPSGSPSGPGGESPGGSGGGSPGGSSGESSAPADTPLPGATSTVVNTVTVTDCSCSASGGAGGGGGGSPAPGGSSVPGGSPSGMTSVPSAAPSMPAPSGGSQPSGGAQPSGPAGGSQPSGSAGSGMPSMPASSSVPHSTPAGGSQPSGSASVPASSASSTPSSSGSSSGSCPTDLSGDYEYPHLIVHLDSSSPDKADGTSYNGTISSTVSTAFNFDIPSSDSGKTCSLVFLFPELKDLETSSYSFSGDGKIDFAKLSSAVSEQTTANNAPSVAQDLGDITVSPGNSYVVSTFSCPAGETVAYEMKKSGSTNLNFFEDYNPSP